MPHAVTLPHEPPTPISGQHRHPALQKTHTPVFVENDGGCRDQRNAAGLGRNTRRSSTLITGSGGSLVIEGNHYRADRRAARSVCSRERMARDATVEPEIVSLAALHGRLAAQGSCCRVLRTGPRRDAAAPSSTSGPKRRWMADFTGGRHQLLFNPQAILIGGRLTAGIEQPCDSSQSDCMRIP